jgi:hypothetical protein
VLLQIVQKVLDEQGLEQSCPALNLLAEI